VIGLITATNSSEYLLHSVVALCDLLELSHQTLPLQFVCLQQNYNRSAHAAIMSLFSLLNTVGGFQHSMLGQLSLPSSGVGKSSTSLLAGVPAYWLGLRRDTFTCVSWQVTVTMRDPYGR